MEVTSPSTASLAANIDRHLAHLKILSRLMGHELHAQTSTRVTLSREELTEMQTSIDLFIEETQRGRHVSSMARVEPAPPLARVSN